MIANRGTAPRLQTGLAIGTWGSIALDPVFAVAVTTGQRGGS
jgi:hypothetical protein